MNLIVDIGNTSVKTAVIEGKTIVSRWCAAEFSESLLCEILESHPTVCRAIVSSSGASGDSVQRILEQRLDYVLRLGPSTPLPIVNGYGTPSTLGADRIAAAVGATMLYGAVNMLIVDFGTAVTYDLVSEGVFLGGNISLGVRGRFRALHEYTSSLPECEPTDERLLFGTTTRTAVEQGVMSGLEFETEGYISRFGAKYENLCIIFTGGDAKYFAKRIKNTIFANRDLVLTGLNGILEYNVERNNK